MKAIALTLLAILEECAEFLETKSDDDAIRLLTHVTEAIKVARREIPAERIVLKREGGWWVEQRDGSHEIHAAYRGDGSNICVARINPWVDNASRTAALLATAPELQKLAWQYRDDLRHPPAPDSVKRRLDLIQKTLAKCEANA
jgi:hypothetical protein